MASGKPGRPRIIGGEQSTQTAFRLSQETVERLRVLARKENRSVSSLLRQAITDYLKGMENAQI